MMTNRKAGAHGMLHIIKRLALLLIPVYLWLAFFVAFEPNNYFGLKGETDSSQPVARVRAYQTDPGTRLIIGDSRLAHFDMDLVSEVSGQEWQNLAFGGASLRESLDLADFVLDSGNEVESILFELSFYTVNANYDTDRFSTLEDTLNNPLAYCLNLEYNVNALTMFMNTVNNTPDSIESGDWGPADYFDADGNSIPVHRKLYEYPGLIDEKCRSWSVNEEELVRLGDLARRCSEEGIELTIVLPPMADLVRTEVCEKYHIDQHMQEDVLPLLNDWSDDYGCTVLDYEWGGSCITDDDTQFFDGFHLDEKYGLPDWTRQLFTEMGA